MKKALLIVDMSNDFVDDKGTLTCGKAGQQIVDAILTSAKNYLSNGDLVIFCMDWHQPNDEHFSLWTPHNIENTWGAELYGKLDGFYQTNKQNPHVFFVKKPEYDAFYKTDLAQILHDHNVDTVRVCGVCTDICVFNTVYGAYKEKFKTQVCPKECATFTENGSVFIKQMQISYQTEIVD